MFLIRGERAAKDAKRIDRDECLASCRARVEVRRLVIVEVDAEGDSIDASDPGHTLNMMCGSYQCKLMSDGKYRAIVATKAETPATLSGAGAGGCSAGVA